MTDVLGDAPAATGWIVDDSTFAARLALVRHRMGWNVKEAAREVGLAAASWRSWEEGAQPHRKVEISERIAERTGCDFGWLLVGPRLSEGRVLTTVGQPGAEKITRTKFSQSPMANRSRPNGHPNRTQPHPSTRRPARLSAGLTLAR